jgi:hypothetical protein
MSVNAMDDARLLNAINNNRCPDCGNYGFAMGPRGGAGRNIFCANPACRAGFMIAPLDEVLIVQRIDKGRDCLYGPLAHVMSTVLVLPGSKGEVQLPLCVFNTDGPDHWPIGHSVAQNVREITCPDCRRAATGESS